MQDRQKTFTVNSSNGPKTVVFNFSSFQDGMRLITTIRKIMANNKELLQSGNTESLAIAIQSDMEVNNAVLKCLEKCTYEGQAINNNLLNTSMDLVSSYMEIALKCIEFYSQFFFPQNSSESQ